MTAHRDERDRLATGTHLATAARSHLPGGSRVGPAPAGDSTPAGATVAEQR